MGKCLIDFYTHLAVCHTAMIETEADGITTKYSASSPDELALVMGAKDCGIIYSGRTTTMITI